MIDPHVHLRDWNEREKETILHGMESGFLSGIDTFFDMPNTNPPLTSRDNILRRIEDGIKAEYKRGVLKLTLPKAAQKTFPGRRISIE